MNINKSKETERIVYVEKYVTINENKSTYDKKPVFNIRNLTLWLIGSVLISYDFITNNSFNIILFLGLMACGVITFNVNRILDDPMKHKDIDFMVSLVAFVNAVLIFSVSPLSKITTIGYIGIILSSINIGYMVYNTYKNR